MAQLRHRGHATLRERLHAVRMAWVLALQAGLAAALSWTAAHELLNNPQPVFAPISAVGTLAASVGQRMRRTVELIIGVALGVLIGDILIYFFGTGPWQLGVVVLLAIVVAVFLGGSVAIVIQAAATAVLIVTLSPSVADLEFPRFVDAFVGGGVALLVTALLLPLNPLRVINRAARPALDLLADQLTEAAEALVARDPARCQRALDRLRRNQPELEAFSEAIEGAKETTTISPARWHRREALTHYAEAAEPVDRAMRNSGTLIRRAVTLIEDEEPIPEAMSEAVRSLAESVRVLRHEFAVGKDPDDAREWTMRAVCHAGRAYREGVGFSGSVVIAQIRTTASDLIKASGLDQDEANRLVRQAFGDTPRPPGEQGRAPDDQPAG
ncbi:FUSC family protein [Micromonospora sp. CPCC 206060]|uniref:FUSC family protein n=1 Tax=Micromonospora sp. CPCC 206060 TaxID=3122406 RepID=UPI002FEF920C